MQSALAGASFNSCHGACSVVLFNATPVQATRSDEKKKSMLLTAFEAGPFQQGGKQACCMQAGVRSLSRNLAAICRHVAVQIVSEHDKQEQVASSSDSDDTSHNFPQADQSQAAGHNHQQRPAELGHDPASTTGSQQSAATSAGSSAIQQDWESPTTATSGGFFWGSLWGGLKGAFTPPRQPPPPRRHPPQPAAQQGNHKRLRSVDTHILHTSDAYASSGSQLQAGSEHSANHTPQVSKGLVSLGTAGSVDGKEQLSNPYGGVNADMTSLAHTELPFMTVTAQLIEKVLGPRKYNENDSADSLVAPGTFHYCCMCSLLLNSTASKAHLSLATRCYRYC